MEYFNFYRLDTLKLFRGEFPDLSRHSLGFLKDHFKILNKGTAHRALEDSYVLRRVIEAGAKEKKISVNRLLMPYIRMDTVIKSKDSKNKKTSKITRNLQPIDAKTQSAIKEKKRKKNPTSQETIRFSKRLRPLMEEEAKILQTSKDISKASKDIFNQ